MGVFWRFLCDEGVGGGDLWFGLMVLFGDGA